MKRRIISANMSYWTVLKGKISPNNIFFCICFCLFLCLFKGDLSVEKSASRFLAATGQNKALRE